MMRSFHVSAPALTSFEDSRIARPHCHHASLWKHWKPLAANGERQPLRAIILMTSIASRARVASVLRCNGDPERQNVSEMRRRS